MTIPVETIDALEDTFRSITELGESLDDAAWELPSDLPGWSVKDNLSHLIGTERMLHGLPAAERLTDGDGPHVRNQIGEFNEAEVRARRRLTGHEVLAEWRELTAARLATLRAGDDAYFEQPATTPTGPGTLADFLHIRVLDCWAHEQDMRRAVGRPGHLDSAAAAHTVDRLIRTLGIVVGKRAGTPEGGAVAIDITGPVERHLVFEVRDGRAARVEEPTAPPLATVRLDAEAFAVLALGRRSAEELQDRIELGGDVELGRRVAAQLNMMI